MELKRKAMESAIMPFKKPRTDIIPMQKNDLAVQASVSKDRFNKQKKKQKKSPLFSFFQLWNVAYALFNYFYSFCELKQYVFKLFWELYTGNFFWLLSK